MGKPFRRRPELESLESLTLLSGASGAVHEALVVPILVGPAIGPVIHFAGTVRGTYHAGRGLGAPTAFSASGVLAPTGRTSVSGSVQLTVLNPTGSMTFSTRHGKIFATLSTPGLGSPVSYQITGGTGQWAGATGSDVAFVSLSPSGGRGPAHGRLAITFGTLPA